MEDWDAGGSGGGGLRLGKRQSDKGEVDYKSKAGTAWSHSYLNQKPWHPLSYPNQRRKWIAEQTHANHERRAEEIAREFSQEQDFFRQTALFSKKEKEKIEIMKAVSFMYVRPPGYNAESAKAAEIADEKKISDGNIITQDLTTGTTKSDPKPDVEKPVEHKKSKPRDVFGRPLPTEDEFEVLRNAPRLETGMPARVKPFGIEIRNVRCVRCGTFGHQSGDRECPLKDAIMPNEESRLKRDDPLTTIMAQTNSNEPVKWELKQKPGMSPPRGGFQPDDPNQQIVADEIFDEYGGFLNGGDIPSTLLTNFSTGKSKKYFKNKNKHKHKSSFSRGESNLDYKDQFSSIDSEHARESKRSKIKNNELSDTEIGLKKMYRNKERRRLRNNPDSDVDQEKKKDRKRERCLQLSNKHSKSSSDSEVDRRRKKSSKGNHEKRNSFRNNRSRSPDTEIEREKRRSISRKKKIKRNRSVSSDSGNSVSDSGHNRRRSQRHHHKHNCTYN